MPSTLPSRNTRSAVRTASGSVSQRCTGIWPAAFSVRAIVPTNISRFTSAWIIRGEFATRNGPSRMPRWLDASSTGPVRGR